MNQQYRTHKLIHNFTIDFNKLALLHPPLRKHVLILNDRVVCNFTSQETLIILAEAIMKHIFRLKWTCPPGNLCPRIPSRVNYLLWLYLQLPKVETVLDVGTGATLIYPLIGWSLFRWKFIAIQLNQQSLQSSRKIVQVNQLEDVIELRNSSENDMESILHGAIGEEENICLLVCNPPFFEEQADKLSIMQSQQHHVQGGQYAFFFSLYRDSFRYSNITYFSCLLGKSTDFHQIRDFLLKEHKEGFIKMVRFGEIAQGRNIRFIVMWSLSDDM